jgi:hypothetical protein
MERRRSVQRLALLAAPVAAVVAGVAVLGWTWRHPHAFDESGGWGVTASHKQVGDTLYVGMSFPRGRDGGHVVLHGGHANIDSGADNADIELLLCSIDPDAGIGTIGAYVGPEIELGCSALVPIHDQRVDLQYAPMRQQVVLAVTLTHQGTVRISDITLDYSYGWRNGSQRTGGQVTISTEAIER